MFSRVIGPGGGVADAGRLRQQARDGAAAVRAAGGPVPGCGLGPGGGASRFGPGSQQDLAATAGDRISSPSTRPTSRPRRSRSCSARREWLRRYPNVTVTIEGHTDERGTREYNLALGERRAQAVKNVLVALGISGVAHLDDQLRQGAPGVPDSTEEAYAQNRRAVTVVN